MNQRLLSSRMKLYSKTLTCLNSPAMATPSSISPKGPSNASGSRSKGLSAYMMSRMTYLKRASVRINLIPF